MNTAAQYQDIAAIIQGKPAVALSRLPEVWRDIAAGTAETGLSETARHDYAEAARLFAFHGTPLSAEAMKEIGRDFARDRYPGLKRACGSVLQKKTLAAVCELFATFGYSVPAAFYNLLLATAFRPDNDKLMTLFKKKDLVARDRLWDAVLHAVLLVTPVGLYVQSVFSRHGLRFEHVMNCGCITRETADAPFTVALDPALLPAYLQNVVAASFEQYGVNAATSGAARGF